MCKDKERKKEIKGWKSEEKKKRRRKKTTRGKKGRNYIYSYAFSRMETNELRKLMNDE